MATDDIAANEARTDHTATTEEHVSSRVSWRAMAPQMVVEVVSIVFAVLLALGLNAWREARADRALARQAEQSLESELWRNRRVVEGVLPNHRAVYEELVARQAALDAGTVSPEEMDGLDDIQFRSVLIRDSSWRAAQTSGALRHIPYERVTALAEIYTFQEGYADLHRAAMAASLDLDNFDDARRGAQLAAWLVTVQAYIAIEEQLLRLYVAHLEGDGPFASLLPVLTGSPSSDETTEAPDDQP